MKDLIEKIESCGFECEAGPLTMSQDWIDLKNRLEMAEGEIKKMMALILIPIEIWKEIIGK